MGNVGSGRAGMWGHEGRLPLVCASCFVLFTFVDH